MEGRFPFLRASFRLAETFFVEGYRTVVHMARSFRKAHKWRGAVAAVCARHGLPPPLTLRCVCACLRRLSCALHGVARLAMSAPYLCLLLFCCCLLWCFAAFFAAFFAAGILPLPTVCNRRHAVKL